MGQDLGEATLRLTTDKTGLEQGMKDAKASGVQMQEILAGVGEAFVAATAFSTMLIKSYGEAEDATKRLEAAFRAQGNEAYSSTKAIGDLGYELQQTTRFGHEATETAAAVLESLTGMSAEMVKQAIPVIQDTAAALGIDLSTAATTMARGIETGNLSIGRMRIEIDKNLEPAQRFEAIMAELNKRFAGTAEALGETTIGRLTILQTALGELAEVGGRTLAKFLNPLAELITPMVKRLGEFADETLNFNDAMNAVNSGSATAAQNLLYYGEMGKRTEKEIADLTAQIDEHKKSVTAMTLAGEAEIRRMEKDLRVKQEYLKFAKANIDSVKQVAEEQKNAKKPADDLTLAFTVQTQAMDNLTNRYFALGVAARSGPFDTSMSKSAQAIENMTDNWVALGQAMQAVSTEQVAAEEDMANRWYAIGAAAKAAAEAIEDGKRQTEEQKRKTKELANDWISVEQSVYSIALAFAEGNWKAGLLMMIDQVVGLVEAYALAAAAKAFLTFDYGTMAFWLAVAGGTLIAGIGAHSVLGSDKNAAGGADFEVPPGYPNDSFKMGVSSGERVSVTPAGQAPAAEGGPLQVIVNLDSQPILDAVTQGSRRGKVIIYQGAVRP